MKKGQEQWFQGVIPFGPIQVLSTAYVLQLYVVVILVFNIMNNFHITWNFVQCHSLHLLQPPAKCKECKQLLTSPDLRLFPGDNDDAVSLKTLFWRSTVKKYLIIQLKYFYILLKIPATPAFMTDLTTGHIILFLVCS